MATGNMHKNLVKFGNVVFELHKQTQIDRQMTWTYSTQYFTTLMGRINKKVRHRTEQTKLYSILTSRTLC